MVAMSKLHQLGFELLPHPPYSTDLAPSKFFLFSSLKNFLGGKDMGQMPRWKTLQISIFRVQTKDITKVTELTRNIALFMRQKMQSSSCSETFDSLFDLSTRLSD